MSAVLRPATVDDAVELAADAVLVRRRTGTGATAATEPRIAP